MRRSDPTRLAPSVVGPGFGLGRFCLHGISLIRASEETLKRSFFDSLESKRNLCFLIELVYWHLILSDPARSFRQAPRLNPLVVCPGLKFARFNTN